MGAWQQWTGGKCPTDADEYVDIRTRAGKEHVKLRAGMLPWNLWGGPAEISQGDIIEWRLTYDNSKG